MLSQRLIFGSLLIACLLALIYWDAAWSGRAMAEVRAAAEPARALAYWKCGLVVTALGVLLVVLSIGELAALSAAGGYRPVTAWAAFIGAGLVMLPYLEMQQRLTPAWNPVLPLNTSLVLVWLMGGVLGTGLAMLARKTTVCATGDLAMTVWMVLYLGLLGSFMVRIRCIDPGPAGAALFIYFVLTVKSSDIGAYFAGRAVGRHKLAPWVSPGKTIEGGVGAVLASAGVAAGGIWLWNRSQSFGSPPFTYQQAIIFGCTMAVFGQVGDLVESLMKRDVGSKDSGAVLPAFGGLLDILDSLLFTAPVAWVFVTLCRNVG